MLEGSTLPGLAFVQKEDLSRKKPSVKSLPTPALPRHSGMLSLGVLLRWVWKAARVAYGPQTTDQHPLPSSGTAKTQRKHSRTGN